MADRDELIEQALADVASLWDGDRAPTSHEAIALLVRHGWTPPPSEDAVERARTIVHAVVWPALRDYPDDASWVWSEAAVSITEPVIQALADAGQLRTPPERPVGYVVEGKVYHPADVQIVKLDRTPVTQVPAADLYANPPDLMAQIIAKRRRAAGGGGNGD